MTPETRAAAIAWLNDEIRSLRLAPTINGCGMKPEWAEQYDIMQTCLEAVKKCDHNETEMRPDRIIANHFVDPAKMVPLTLEQLRGMDGQPVWMVLVDNHNSCEWMIVCAKEKCCEGKTYIVDFSNIGNLWLAYAYPPAHIDREAWEPCTECGPNELIMGDRYCCECGRPLTPEAWAELERRFRG